MDEAGVTTAGEECAIDYILKAQKKGEITESNVLYLIENINVAGPSPLLSQSNGSDFEAVVDWQLLRRCSDRVQAVFVLRYD